MKSFVETQKYKTSMQHSKMKKSKTGNMPKTLIISNILLANQTIKTQKLWGMSLARKQQNLYKSRQTQSLSLC